ncbi:glutathione peroxidase [[Clostridium] fimetarium]|uniref:Glutathione peroxidase n=1 Tax=[Clostridium] fimetarium TaxID=99656 RepID=A0A1I0NT07_9FIRM|nr:glutathione peroxidase [[Clostridium] fimetarium]SEW04699.1 glutathione peroxidase [[Clostridium] fimetarium]
MSIYDFDVMGQKDEVISLAQYRGKVILIINSATACGFTPQYDELQDMYEKFGEENLAILDFPCNQFGNQAQGTDQEIVSFCDSKYGITFPIFSKIEVNGENAAPLYKYLVKQKDFKGFDIDHPITPMLESMLSRINPDFKNEPDIKWNFTKFLIDRDGNVIDRFEPTDDINLIVEKVKELI